MLRHLHSFPTRRSSDLIKTFKGAGCTNCNGTGYKGRVGLYEVMEITEELRELILVGASGLELRRKAIEDGIDRKSTRLNSSHRCISYAVFCLKKKNTQY